MTLELGDFLRRIPPNLLKCEFAAVGLDQVRFAPIAGTDGYFTAFVARRPRPEPGAIRACKLKS